MAAMRTPPAARLKVRWAFSGDHEFGVGQHGELLEEAETHGEGPATGVDHGITEHHRPGRRARQHRPGVPGGLERLPDLGVLEDRSKVKRRAAAQVDEAGGPHRLGVVVVVGVGPAEHHEAADLGAGRREIARGAVHGPTGMLIGGRRGQHEHLGGAADGQQLRVEHAAFLPFAPTYQSESAQMGPPAEAHDGPAAGAMSELSGDALDAAGEARVPPPAGRTARNQ